MNFVNLDFDASYDEVINTIKDNGRVNEKVKFDERRGIPHMRIKEKNKGKIKITCEMLGRPTKDNAFLVGTYFTGRLIEREGRTKLIGATFTAPVYHLVMLALIIVFVIQCFRMNGFSIVPPLIILFDVFMFKDEWRKQGYIKRYLSRAVRKINNPQK